VGKRIKNFLISFVAVCGVLGFAKINVTEDMSIAIIVISAFLPMIFRRIKKALKRKPKATAAPTVPSTPERLTVSAAPRPTGRSTYITIEPAEALKVKDYVMLDTETTGFSHSLDRIIEIGMIKCIDDKPVDTYTTFVNPDMHIPSKVSRLTGITDVDVKDAPQFDAIAQDVMAFIGELPVVAHNGSFDAGMLASELNYMGLDYIIKVIDTLQLSRKAFPHLSNYKLKTLIDELDLADHIQQHRALDDAEVTHRLFLRCKSELKK